MGRNFCLLRGCYKRDCVLASVNGYEWCPVFMTLTYVYIYIYISERRVGLHGKWSRTPASSLHAVLECEETPPPSQFCFRNYAPNSASYQPIGVLSWSFSSKLTLLLLTSLKCISINLLIKPTFINAFCNHGNRPEVFSSS